MTSDKERREVALRLREIKPEKGLHGHVRAEGVFSACGVYSDFGCVRVDELGKLADLIDRPTTTRHSKFKTKYGSKTPCCEVCGYSIGDMRWNYCPKCGAVIADD